MGPDAEGLIDVVRPPALEARGIVKRFGALVANNGVDLTIGQGEIHALLGENGAGKSTLVKILYGALQPNEGEIRWLGVPTTIGSPAEARALGIGMVFQHFSLFEALTVAENVALGLPPDKSMAEIVADIEAMSRDFGLPIDPHRHVRDLSVGERQRIEIGRALLQNPQLLIMDEPTSVLTPQEADLLFGTLRRLAAEGRSILYITHRLEEVRALCERATVLRHGKVVGHCDPRRETAASLARMMVGSDVKTLVPRESAQGGKARLEITTLSLPAPDHFGTALHDVSLSVRGGEIVAIAGVAGNGQGELFDAISGERLSPPEAVKIDGAPVGGLGITARRKRGGAFVPEERLGHGAAPRFSLSDNAALTRYATAGMVRIGMLLRSKAKALSEAVIGQFDVRKGAPDPEAGSLSGGNLQKFVVGREVLAGPGVLVVNQPTWGVDAGAAAVIRQSLIDLAANGAAVLVISQDLDEILEIADRIAVIHHGHLSDPEPAATVTLERIGLLMGGARPELDTESVDAA
ncbi:ABC transporter ATP-binding protein [Segnochrobactrum spirostomi]|uniref:ABC transporter ATP-binding protein n=1 Tax=Segnochrobactrum spirostomi TaxID=2608987 RepID=A0A6A7Y787_9HYPH|nr:ABC transporter ATP-binding protein [Segnochrobactrum spirostomi]MQT14177.1 ABC transporter ATP-binding protein [Segnochrobactrum spirostomi]